MTPFKRFILLLSLVLSPLRAATESSSSITIYLYNYADVGDRILSETEAQASRILASAGIDATWLRSPLREHDDDPQQVREHRLTPSDLFVRIHARSSNLPRAESRYSLGYALIPTGQSTPQIAGVLYQKVQEVLRLSVDTFSFQLRGISSQPIADRYVAILLGHAIAHEIGHLLLGRNEHARRGLMQAGWDARARAFAIAQRLHFTEPESRKMREEIRRRIGVPDSLQSIQSLQLD